MVRLTGRKSCNRLHVVTGRQLDPRRCEARMGAMRWLDEHNTLEYLREVGWIDAREAAEVHPLTGGVSNQVLYVARAKTAGPDFVVKQVRPQLRVPDPWFSTVERIWREVEVLEVCRDLLSQPVDPSLRVELPQVLHTDREEFVFAMTAAPREHRVWKRELLDGRTSPEIARQCGRLLGRLHGASWCSPAVEARLADRSIFDELRLDPYYRTVAQRHPDVADKFARLIDSVADHCRSLVHADFSPKNLLLAGERLMMVDFETGHYGDPAFDLGFFLAHLMLKAVNAAPGHGPYLDMTRQFWGGYRSELWARIPRDESESLEARGILHFAGCTWARLDGKSQVDYLHDGNRRDLARNLCRAILTEEPQRWEDVLGMVAF